MRRARDRIGLASVVAYLVVVALVQATGTPDWQSLAASAADVAHGQLWLLLSSGLVIDGLPWLQFSVLVVVLALAYTRVGAARLWTAGLVAHIGAGLHQLDLGALGGMRRQGADDQAERQRDTGKEMLHRRWQLSHAWSPDPEPAWSSPSRNRYRPRGKRRNRSTAASSTGRTGFPRT